MNGKFESISRRDALHQLSHIAVGLGTAGLLLPALSSLTLSGCHSNSSPTNPSTFEYNVPSWTGDTFALMHQIRDGNTPQAPQKPSQHHDVVIVGGGLSGLTVATQLIHEDFLLLEREQTLGGNAKSDNFNGIEYALGSAYLVDVSEPFGPFYESLGLTLKPLPEASDYLVTDYLVNTQNHLASLPKSSVGKEFDRMKSFLSALLKHPDFPKSPVKESTTNALKLDTITFSEFLKNEQYSSAFIQLVNAYCWSALGGSVNSISAYAGLNFYSEIASPVYAFPGGNAAVAKAMVTQIQKAGANRMRTGVAVTEIKHNSEVANHSKEGYLVSFLDGQTNEMITVSCRIVVMAIPYFFAGRLLPFLPKSTIQTMKSLQYGAYLVGNFCFDQPILKNGGYDHWVLNSASRDLAKKQNNPDIPFTDFIDAGFSQRHLNPTQEQVGSVITVYAPFQNPWQGRVLLKNGDKDAIAQSLVNAFQQSVPFENKHLQSVRLTRYGHQLLTSKKGIIETVCNLPKEIQGLIFAHSDGQGMAAIESAILEGLSAADRVKERLKKVQISPLK